MFRWLSVMSVIWSDSQRRAQVDLSPLSGTVPIHSDRISALNLPSRAQRGADRLILSTLYARSPSIAAEFRLLTRPAAPREGTGRSILNTLAAEFRLLTRPRGTMARMSMMTGGMMISRRAA